MCSTGQESQDFNSVNNLCSSHQKKQSLAGSLAYSRLGFLTKQAPISAGFSASLASLDQKEEEN